MTNADNALGFLGFVLTLKKGFYKYQFGQFIATHMVAIIITTQLGAAAITIYQALYWYAESALAADST